MTVEGGEIVPELRDRLYISTVASDAVECAAAEGVGLEIADFCVASNMDETWEPYGRLGEEKMALGRPMTFHFPFAELCPCAIDPLVRRLTTQRYRQALELARSHGIHRMIVHAGFIPEVYYPEWFVEQSVLYWRDFLSGLEGDVLLCLENVMEPDPAPLREIIDEVDDPRLRLCLDLGHCAHCSPLETDKWIRSLNKRIAQVHLHNNDRQKDRHWPLERGVLDIAGLIDQVLDAAPEARFTLECLESAGSIRWLGDRGYLK